MKSLKEYFNALNLARIEYVVLSDTSVLPHSVPKEPIRVLVSNKEMFCKMLDLIKTVNTVFTYCNRELRTLKFEVIESGQGYFPVKFEQVMFARHIRNDNDIKIPDNIRSQWYSLYEIFVHEQEPTEHHRRSILKSIRENIDIVPCSYPTVTVKGVLT